MRELPKVEALSHEEKNVIIRALWDEVQKLRGLEEKKVEKTLKILISSPNPDFIVDFFQLPMTQHKLLQISFS